MSCGIPSQQSRLDSGGPIAESTSLEATNRADNGRKWRGMGSREIDIDTGIEEFVWLRGWPREGPMATVGSER